MQLVSGRVLPPVLTRSPEASLGRQEVSVKVEIRKVQKAGSSNYVTLPREMLEALELEPGDHVSVELVKSSECIRIRNLNRTVPTANRPAAACSKG